MSKEFHQGCNCKIIAKVGRVMIKEKSAFVIGSWTTSKKDKESDKWEYTDHAIALNCYGDALAGLRNLNIQPFDTVMFEVSKAGLAMYEAKEKGWKAQLTGNIDFAYILERSEKREKREYKTKSQQTTIVPPVEEEDLPF